MLLRCLALLAGLILALSPAEALEIYRNSTPYQITATLPAGAYFREEGVDRKFDLGQVSGNLRLIQDEYASCRALTDERQQNWVKYGFDLASAPFDSPAVCSITLNNRASGETVTSFYIRIDSCACFAALHFRFPDTARADFMAFAPTVVTSLLLNSADTAGIAESLLAGLGAPPRTATSTSPSPSASTPAAAGPAPQPGPAGSAISRVSATLAPLACAPKPATRAEEAQTALVLLSAWTGTRIDDLAERVGVRDRDRWTWGDFPGNDPVALGQIERILSGHDAALSRMTADVATYGNALCGVLSQALNEDFGSTLSLQRDFNSVFHGYLKAAQQLTQIHGCTSGEIDGAFGGGSRATWNRMLEALGKVPESGAFTPTLSDVMAAGMVAVTAPACSGTPASASARPIPVAPFLFASGYRQAGWLAKQTPELSALMDALAEDGTWAPFQQDLARSLIHEPYGAEPGAAARMLAKIYRQGIGVARSSGAADFWTAQAVATPTLYQRYLDAADRGTDLAGIVRDLVATLPGENGYEEPALSGPMVTSQTLELTIDGRVTLARLAHLVMKHPQALEQVAALPRPKLQYSLAERLLDGASVLGKGTGEALTLLRASAAAGTPYAASHLAFMLDHGNGATASQAEIDGLLKMAAKTGEPFANYQLARRAERQAPGAPAEALRFYEAMITRNLGEYRTLAGSELIANRMMAGNLALASPKGKALIEARAKTDQDFARTLAELYLCASCGGSVDLAEGARWLRLLRDADVRQAGVTLSRLLTLAPELARSPDEPRKSLEQGIRREAGPGSPFAYDNDISAAVALQALDATGAGQERTQDLSRLLDQLCDSPTADADDCETAAKFLASGAFGTDLVAVGVDRLESRTSLALVDVLAAYGDFTGALRLGLAAEKDQLLGNSGVISPQAEARSPLTLDPNTLRTPTLRRIIAQRDPGDLSSLPPGFVEYLALLARNGDAQAQAYQQILSQPRTQPLPLASDLARARDTFESVKARGGLSMALVTSARVYASGLKDAGERDQALDLELTALAAERQLDRVAGIGSGALQGQLTTVCHLSKASERIFALGSDDIALVLAKDVINELQGVRRDLSAIPERLQGCFRDLVSDNYRWLADLLVRQDRLEEAEFVLSLLKDFEAFQFSGRDTAFAGDAFREIPYSPSEQALKTALDDLRLPTVSDVRERLELLARQAIQGLNAQDQTRLAEIDRRLTDAQATYEQGLKRIREAAATLSETPATANIAASQTTLAAQASVQQTILAPLKDKAVAIHYLVMPDRLNILVTTRDSRESFTLSDWDGEPFTEARLNGFLEDYHLAVSNPGVDVRPMAQRLHALLLGPVEPLLARETPELLLVSLDRRLRYMPFQTLHDGSRFLVERFALSLLTSSETEISGRQVTDIPFAALGMTQETELFSALPGVEVELDGIVKGDNGFGLFDGEVFMDKAFDQTALVRALRIGEGNPQGLGVVHISSHFYLGESEADSFLLLGTGDHLSLSTIKDDPADFDFRHVELLTLSACETGRANASSDGREIESLAKITSDRGAGSTIASLWPVADASTALLMQRFYELKELGGMSKAEALAVAQREFIAGKVGSQTHLATRSVVFETARRFAEPMDQRGDGLDPGFSHPFYWAPFVLTGNWR